MRIFDAVRTLDTMPHEAWNDAVRTLDTMPHEAWKAGSAEMPGRPHHTQKMQDCVQKLIAKGHDEASAFAICTTSLKEAGEPILESAEARHVHLVGATGAIRTAKHWGRDHLVVPVVALREGVIFPINAETPELVLARELASTPPSWNGRPAFVGHPMKNGTQVSGNTPDILETSFGIVFHAAMSGPRLIMEAWLDPQRAEAVGPHAVRVLERLRAGEVVEVSVGVFVVAEKVPGMYNGKKYMAIWHEITPDHLAFLPEGTIGACSVEMGCGSPRHAMVHQVTEDSFEVLQGSTLTGGNPEDEQLEEQAVPGKKDPVDTPEGKITPEQAAADSEQQAESNPKAQQMSQAFPVFIYPYGVYAKNDLPSETEHGQMTSTSTENMTPRSVHKTKAAASRHAAIKTRRTGIPHVVGDRVVSSHSTGQTNKSLEGRESEVHNMTKEQYLVEYLRTCRDISDKTRANMPSEDFAGKGTSYPIKNQEDVDAAVHAIGRVGDDNYSGDTLKKNIISIAKRKGLSIPDAWKEQKAAQSKTLRQRVMQLLKIKTAGATNPESSEDAEETAELIQYKTIEALFEQVGSSYDEALSLAQELISNETGEAPANSDEEDAEDEIEEARLESICSHCMQMMGSLSGVTSITRALLADENEDSYPGIMAMAAKVRTLVGARHNVDDQAMVQQMHDTSVALGADCDEVQNTSTSGINNKPDSLPPNGLSQDEVDQYSTGTRIMAGKVEGLDTAPSGFHVVNKGKVTSSHDNLPDAKVAADVVATNTNAPATVVQKDSTNADAVTVSKHYPKGSRAAQDADCGCGGSAQGETMTKGERIKTLVETKTSGFSAEDAKWLEQVPETRLEALEMSAKAGIRVAATKADAEKVIMDKHSADQALEAHATMLKSKADAKDAADKDNELNPDTTARSAAGKQMTEEEFLKCAPDSIRTLVSTHKAAETQHRLELIGKLKVAAAGVYTEEELKAMTTDNLERAAKLAKVDAPKSYAGFGLPRLAENAPQEAPPPPDLVAAIRAAAGKKNAA